MSVDLATELARRMDMPKGRDDAVAYLCTYVEDTKTSGFVAKALARHKIEAAAVAPWANE